MKASKSGVATAMRVVAWLELIAGVIAGIALGQVDWRKCVVRGDARIRRDGR